MEKALTMFLAGSGILIGVYLIVTNPTGTSQAGNSITGFGTSTIKSLQGR